MEYDFGGWATRCGVKCSDGVTIMHNAFEQDDGVVVPLVWNHQHNDSMNVLGHAQLENRESGVYAYCTLNDTEQGKNARLLIEHGDVTALSIYANQLKRTGSCVTHGAIREVSLVLAGANPGAFIDSIIKHGEESEEEAIIYAGEDITLSHGDGSLDDFKIMHSDDESKKSDRSEEDDITDTKKKTDDLEDEESSEKDYNKIFEGMTDEQKEAVYVLVGLALDASENNENKEEDSNNKEDDVKHNVFESKDPEYNGAGVISHSDMDALWSASLADGKRYGSLKESFIAHADDYGINDIDYLFPDARNVTETPEFIQRRTDWVAGVINGVHHTPFSRIKSIFADITEDDARARGYIKGNLKVEEVFSLLKRTTTPQTIYKKQKLDRDDVIDITDFDVVAWLKAEMRVMLDEEIARAILVGDGRLSTSDDKINEDNIRPIWTDDELYTIKAGFTPDDDATDDDNAKAFIKAAIKARKDYKGSGVPTLYTTEDVLTDCLLIEDSLGRVIYDSVDKLTTVLRVDKIVTVPVMEDLTRDDTDDEGAARTNTLLGIIVNLADYTVGADKGGAINMFDDFDIDYNQQKYLIETRCSGALTKPYSAIAIESYSEAVSG